MRPPILIVDDDAATRFAVGRYLESAGYATLEAGTLGEARKVLAGAGAIDGILLDLGLPDGNGLDLIPEIRDAQPDAAIVVVTGVGDVPKAVEAMRRGADHFLLKPARPQEIAVVLQKSLELSMFRKRNTTRERTDRKPAPFWGNTRPVAACRALADRAAHSDTAVLVLGETGTGKGVLARWIHERSARAAQPLVSLNCSTLRGDLLLSELFGHSRGAFTSAVDERRGLLDAADRGTLFLDEIGEMDPSVQSLFLNVLEEKRYRRIGENRERASDFRLICATNRLLTDDAFAGRFRRDLLFRISVFPIEIPPLRHRLEDLEPLVQHLISALGEPDASLTPEALALLFSYPWPGNIRELKNVLERALLLAGRAPLGPEHFPGLTYGHLEPASLPGQAAGTPDISEPDDARIDAALKLARGNKSKAAKLLGISRATLYRWLG